MALCLLEVYYNTSSISVLSFHYLIQFEDGGFMFYNIHPFALVSQLKKKIIQSSFWARKGIFFICQSKQESFVFATFNTSWLSYSTLLMIPRNFSWVPVLLDSCPCCLSPSFLGHPLHLALGNTLTAGSSACRMTAGCRTKMTACLRCYSCSEVDSWTPPQNLCF